MNYSPDSEWKKLGEIDLSTEEYTQNLIYPWLEKMLAPLNLSLDFMAFLLKSADKVTARALNRDPSIIKHAHLTVYIPHGPIPEGKTWGFFHTERNEFQEHAERSPAYKIDFYLFIEAKFEA